MSRTWEDPRRVLARHGLAPKRSYSQNFLISERAVRAIVEYSFTRSDLIRIYAMVFGWNPASMRVLEKAGFSYEGRDFTAKGQIVDPAPVQLPHPPIWIGGNSARSRERVARFGEGWAPMFTGNVSAAVTRTAELRDLDDLSRATGGLHFRINGSSDIPRVADRIGEALHNLYVLGYYPSAGGEGFRKIQVKATVPNVRLAARPGYYAARSSSGDSRLLRP